MAEARIWLSLYNDKGAVAGIGGSDLKEVDIVLHKGKRDPKAICLEAAKRLRKLADDFERLSVMDEPFRESTQREAAKAAT